MSTSAVRGREISRKEWEWMTKIAVDDGDSGGGGDSLCLSVSVVKGSEDVKCAEEVPLV